MSINDNNDWRKVEQIAQRHEINEADHFLPVAPVPTPTTAQQLSWATVRCAQLQASIHRKNGAMSEAMMFISINEPDRAREALARAFLDL